MLYLDEVDLGKSYDEGNILYLDEVDVGKRYGYEDDGIIGTMCQNQFVETKKIFSKQVGAKGYYCTRNTDERRWDI